MTKTHLIALVAILLAVQAANAAGPGAFTLSGATPSCSGSSPQITLTWTASSGVST